MKVVTISDSHDQHQKCNIPECDIFIHAGDMNCHRTPNLKRVHEFSKWLRDVPARYVIVIAGNHDVLFEVDPYLALSLLPRHVIYLKNELVDIEGINIYGSPYTRKWDNWAFNMEDYPLERNWSFIPEETDILVTHMPPYGILDLNVLGTHKEEDPHCGCKHLRNRVREVNPKYHIFGHIHEGFGVEEKGETIFINASQVDYKNDKKNAVITFTY